ncbi:glycosyltransferase [Rhizobium halophytocola]|uniref:Succinoglycan biosynthesis protein ExoM n=1 Tax=Rhizobium halophytocola TaxID=735519 RepID=A0ABS4E4S6_9HYPH|nr:glycosyltransferase [Rhizobium halophytocola]MBP1852957.1 succinoglycan biosynthesis protein ExoM [Rhizobium halophytocola]
MTAPVLGTTRIDIGICTFQRPALRDTLMSLFALTVPPDVAVRLIVADNDAQPSARDLVEELHHQSPFPISYVHCPKANISIARNACLTEATGDFLAFIDDDEMASPGWLVELYGVALQTDADAVLGPVQAVYGEASPPWMRKGDFHSTLPVWVNGVIRTGYTCNVLLDMRSRRIIGRRFDLALGQSGGEDTQFFSALTEAGGEIAFAPRALIEEPVPARRSSFDWLAKRRFRSGQTHGRILALKHSGAARLSQSALAVTKLGVCALMTVATAFSPIVRNRYALRAALHAGAVTGLLGFREIRQYGVAEAS